MADVLSAEQLKFIEDYSTLNWDRAYLVGTYGEQNVTEWLKQMDIILAIKQRTAEVKHRRAEAKELFLSEWLHLRGKALEGLVTILNNPDHNDHAKVCLKILGAEISYIESMFKKKGEIDGEIKDDRVAPIIELIRAKKSDNSTGSSS